MSVFFGFGLRVCGALGLGFAKPADLNPCQAKLYTCDPYLSALDPKRQSLHQHKKCMSTFMGSR